MKRIRYSNRDKDYFFRCLGRYKKALESMDDILYCSIEIHVALAKVPKSYKRFVTKTFSETMRRKMSANCNKKRNH